VQGGKAGEWGIRGGMQRWSNRKVGEGGGERKSAAVRRGVTLLKSKIGQQQKKEFAEEKQFERATVRNAT